MIVFVLDDVLFYFGLNIDYSFIVQNFIVYVVLSLFEYNMFSYSQLNSIVEGFFLFGVFQGQLFDIFINRFKIEFVSVLLLILGIIMVIVIFCIGFINWC